MQEEDHSGDQEAIDYSSESGKEAAVTVVPRVEATEIFQSDMMDGDFDQMLREASVTDPVLELSVRPGAEVRRCNLDVGPSGEHFKARPAKRKILEDWSEEEEEEPSRKKEKTCSVTKNLSSLNRDKETVPSKGNVTAGKSKSKKRPVATMDQDSTIPSKEKESKGVSKNTTTKAPALGKPGSSKSFMSRGKKLLSTKSLLMEDSPNTPVSVTDLIPNYDQVHNRSKEAEKSEEIEDNMNGKKQKVDGQTSLKSTKNIQSHNKLMNHSKQCDGKASKKKRNSMKKPPVQARNFMVTEEDLNLPPLVVKRLPRILPRTSFFESTVNDISGIGFLDSSTLAARKPRKFFKTPPLTLEMKEARAQSWRTQTKKVVKRAAKRLYSRSASLAGESSSKGRRRGRNSTLGLHTGRDSSFGTNTGASAKKAPIQAASPALPTAKPTGAGAPRQREVYSCDTPTAFLEILYDVVPGELPLQQVGKYGVFLQ